MSVLETVTEQWASDYADEHGYLSFKLTPHGQRGWPDRLFVNRYGVHIYVEFKQKGKKLRKLQEFRSSQLTDRGCTVFAIDNKPQIKEILYKHEYASRLD